MDDAEEPPTTALERGRSPSPGLGWLVLRSLAEQAALGSNCTAPAPRDAVRECWIALLTPIGPYWGRRRQSERFREIDRVGLMLSEGWLAWEHYALRRTRQEVGEILGLTVRQLRRREAMLQRAIDYFGLDRQVKPAFQGRPPARGWKPATGRGPRARLAAQLGFSERTLYRHLHQGDVIDIDILDRAVCNWGSPALLRDLYPELYDDADSRGVT